MTHTTLSTYRCARALWGRCICALAFAAARTGSPAPAAAVQYNGPPAKYVFLFIGDGMGLHQRTAAELYMKTIREKEPGRISHTAQLAMNQLPTQGMCTTYAANSLITESAAAATAIATGRETKTGIVNMDPSRTIRYKTVTELAKKNGMKVGIVSSTPITDATPACFYAHQPNRNKYYEIGYELATSDVDYFGGGGPHHPRGPKGRRRDVREIAKANGFFIVDTRHAFRRLHRGLGKVWAIHESRGDGESMPYELDRHPDDVTLAEYTRKGIELLDNPNGFLLVVEGGKIDWACHANDAAAAIMDTLALDAAVAEASRFMDKHPDETLVIVTADHECGAMSLGFAGVGKAGTIEKLRHQRMSYSAFDKTLESFKRRRPGGAAVVRLIEETFGLKVPSNRNAGKKKKDPMMLTDHQLHALQTAFKRSMSGERVRSRDDHMYVLYGGYEPFTVTLTHTLNQKAGITWGSYGHTASPVPVSAGGIGHELFNGYYHNTDVGLKIMAVMYLAPAP